MKLLLIVIADVSSGYSGIAVCRSSPPKSPEELNGFLAMSGDADEDGEGIVANGILVEAKRGHILDGTKGGRGTGSGRGGRL